VWHFFRQRSSGARLCRWENQRMLCSLIAGFILPDGLFLCGDFHSRLSPLPSPTLQQDCHAILRIFLFNLISNFFLYLISAGSLATFLHDIGLASA